MFQSFVSRFLLQFGNSSRFSRSFVCDKVGGGVVAVVDTLYSSQEFSQENINSCRNKITVKTILIRG